MRRRVGYVARCIAGVVAGIALGTACQTPVVVKGLEGVNGLTGAHSPVPEDEVEGLIRYHARAALAADAAGNLADADAHLKAHRSLVELTEGRAIDPGVDPKALKRLDDKVKAREPPVAPPRRGPKSRPQAEPRRGSSEGSAAVAAVAAPLFNQAGEADEGSSGTPEIPRVVARAPGDGPIAGGRSPYAESGTSDDRDPRNPPPPDERTSQPSDGAGSKASMGKVLSSGRGAVGPSRGAAGPKHAEPAAPKGWLEDEVRRILVEFGEDQDVRLPPTFMGEVKRAVDDFTVGRRRQWFATALRRMDRYVPTIHGIFSERRLPEIFYYLALVESGFNPDAESRKGAVGLWQFMPETARYYGLEVGRSKDQRRDPNKSSEAAREYLLDLVLEFGDGHSMLLAMAAYNAGEGRVRYRLRKLDDYRNRSFWTLSERHLLPPETRRYVPTIIAAAVVGRNRGRFRFPPPLPAGGVTTVELRRPVSIPYLLRAAQIAKAYLLALNPTLDPTSKVTPSRRFALVLPTEAAERLQHDPLMRRAMTSEFR